MVRYMSHIFNLIFDLQFVLLWPLYTLLLDIRPFFTWFVRDRHRRLHCLRPVIFFRYILLRHFDVTVKVKIRIVKHRWIQPLTNIWFHYLVLDIILMTIIGIVVCVWIYFCWFSGINCPKLDSSVINGHLKNTC